MGSVGGDGDLDGDNYIDKVLPTNDGWVVVEMHLSVGGEEVEIPWCIEAVGSCVALGWILVRSLYMEILIGTWTMKSRISACSVSYVLEAMVGTLSW